MSQLVQLCFVLFGPRKGQTIVINGHQFVKGEYLLAQSSDNVGHIMKVLSFYGAYAKGTPEYDEALAREKAEEELNGADEVHEEAEQGPTDEVLGDRGSDGEGLASQEAAVSLEPVEAETGGAGFDTFGDGHEHAGIPKFEETLNPLEPTEPSSSINEAVKAALLKLDPNEDRHWVMTGGRKGKPRLSAVEEAYGKAGLTIDDLETALPGWDRDRASEKQTAAA